MFYPLFNYQIRKINGANSANKMAILRTTIIRDSLALPLQLQLGSEQTQHNAGAPRTAATNHWSKNLNKSAVVHTTYA